MKIHILAIVGQGMTTPLALALKNQGHQVSGSDQDKIYPPASTQLQSVNIPINTTPIDNSIDLVIVGSAVNNHSRTKQEFEQVKKLNLPYISATNYIAKYLIKSESIIVAGSYGKTTTTALLAHILPDSNYFFGGMSVDNQPSCNFSSSRFSIVEGDESINGLDTQAKFLYYPTKYLILTSAAWEHKESYPTYEDNLMAYQRLVEKLPQDGVLVYNQNDADIQKILPSCIAKKVPYIDKTFDTKLLGEHNQQNICAVYTLCRELGLDDSIVLPAIKSFLGVKSRLELISDTNNVLFYSDFAQSAPRIMTTISTLKQKYPQRAIKVILEPHASFLQYKNSIAELKDVFVDVDHIYLTKLSFSKNNDKDSRITFNDYKLIFSDKINYLPITTDLINTVAKSLNRGDILVRLSSGGLDGYQAFDNIIKQYQSL